MRGSLRHVLVLRAFSAAFSPLPRQRCRCPVSRASSQRTRTKISQALITMFNAANLHTPWSANDDALLWSRQQVLGRARARRSDAKPAGVRARRRRGATKSSAASERLFGADAEPADARSPPTTTRRWTTRACSAVQGGHVPQLGARRAHAFKVDLGRAAEGRTGGPRRVGLRRAPRSTATARSRSSACAGESRTRAAARAGSAVIRSRYPALTSCRTARVGLLPWAPRSKASPPVVGKKNPERPRGEQASSTCSTPPPQSRLTPAAYLHSMRRSASRCRSRHRRCGRAVPVPAGRAAQREGRTDGRQITAAQSEISLSPANEQRGRTTAAQCAARHSGREVRVAIGRLVRAGGVEARVPTP